MLLRAKQTAAAILTNQLFAAARDAASRKVLRARQARPLNPLRRLDRGRDPEDLV